MTKWLWGFDLNSDVEKRMWEMAWHVYGDSLGEILSLALAGYKRSSGLDDLTRLYPSTAGHQVLSILRKALLVRWPDVDFGQSELCVELRSRLRSHLNQYLLRRLVFEHAAPRCCVMCCSRQMWAGERGGHAGAGGVHGDNVKRF